MEDSFFGFNTSVPLEDDRGGGQNGIEEAPEEEYDALNDETFGSAINGDWEGIHENLVRLDGLNGSKEFKDDDENSDLEINFSGVKLDDFDLGSDDNENRLTLDPKVWEHPKTWDKPSSSGSQKPQTQNSSQNNTYASPEAYLRQHFSNPFENLTRRGQTNQFGDITDRAKSSSATALAGTSNLPGFQLKFCTVDDIERNIRNQQQQQQQQQKLNQQRVQPKQQQPQQVDQQRLRQQIQQQQQQLQQQQHLQNQHQLQQQHKQQQQQQQQQQQHQFQQIRPPTPKPKLPAAQQAFTAPRPNLNLPPHPLNVPHRVPPGFPPMSMMGSHPLTGMQHHNNFLRSMTPNVPLALHNFASHPNFAAMRPVNPQLPQPRLAPHLAMMNQNMQSSSNMFNRRLVQEIQQNHPMLTNYNRGYNNHMNMNNGNNMHNHNQYHHHNQNQQAKFKQNMRSNGNLPEEYDEYANLMSTRDKHWLIAIQLSQLHTDTPYIDDYYYTVFKERKATLNGERESRAHKDNQLNHPLTQPKGHAQLVLISMGKNGTNVRNGQNRERKISETKNDKEQTPRTFTPLQFENSLGKLQYGSVTAPRKLIDMEVMGTDGNPQFNTSVELSAQRKSRQLLMHIETMYRIVLKLEDLQNPAAIATQLALKEKHEMEQKLAKSASTETAESGETSLNSSLSDKHTYEVESRDKLMPKLLACLTTDKIVGMMNVRKGKTLLRRIMPHIEDNPIRWNVWAAMFSSLQTVLKKDKDDTDSVLYSIYPEFKKHLANAEMNDIVKVATAIPLNDKKMTSFFNSKFCLSSLVAILVRVEEIYTKTEVDAETNEKWSQFLSILATSLNRTIQNQTISATIESDAIQPMVDHLTRFKDYLDSLMTLFSQTKKQVD